MGIVFRAFGRRRTLAIWRTRLYASPPVCYATCMATNETHRNRMSNAIRIWLIKLDEVEGWRDYKEKQIEHTLGFDGQVFMRSEPIGDFIFPPKLEKEHAVITQYLDLIQTIEALKECEFYFRRYPFKRLPVSRHAHIRNICEMYFNRFYEIKSRLKKYFNALKELKPDHSLDIGKFIKLFDSVFDQELRARNRVNHHGRFDDIAIDRVFITAVVAEESDYVFQKRHLAAYRKTTNEWAKRVRGTGARMDEFLEATAKATLAVCDFLRP